MTAAPNIPPVSFWKGKNVDELTREEAIDALKECGAQLQNLLEVNQCSNRVHAMLHSDRRRQP
jgi:hypothetical protein